MWMSHSCSWNRHGWDIHAVSRGPDRTAGREHRSREHSESAGAPGGAAQAGGSGRRRVPDAAHDGHRTNLYADRTGG